MLYRFQGISETCEAGYHSSKMLHSSDVLGCLKLKGSRQCAHLQRWSQLPSIA